MRLAHNIEFVTFYKLGYLLVDVPADVMHDISQETQEMEDTNFDKCIPYNQYLVGNIEKEFFLVKSVPVLNKFIGEVAPRYWDAYNNNTLKNKKHIINNFNTERPDVWVNFQKKYELNPPHKHHGGSLSFVLYVKIPYSFATEAKSAQSKNSMAPSAGTFQFLYNDQYNQGGVGLTNLKTDKAFEGKMIIFSIDMYHQVFPFFTSDEYRISVAGNIGILNE